MTPASYRGMSYSVTIDGVPTTLTFDSHSWARGYQYLTPDNGASHAFYKYLVPGTQFRTNGHDYSVLEVRA